MRLASLVLSAVALLALVGCFPEQWAEVSPDGKYLIYAGLEHHKGAYLMTPDGKQARKLADAGYAPQFSPDNRYVAFQGNSGLVLHEAATGKSRALLKIEKEKESSNQAAYMFPQWRPDGKALAVVVWRGISNDRSETALHLFADLENPQPQIVAEGVGFKCGWSPDGKRLAFFRKEGPGAELPQSELFWGSLNIHEEGEGTKAVAGVLFNPWQSVQWLSNDRLLFMGSRISLPITVAEANAPRVGIHAYDLVTKGISLVLETPGASGEVISQWFMLSPNRKRMLYYPLREDVKRAQLRLYDIATGQSEVLVHDQDMPQHYPFWIGNDRLGLFANRDVILMADVEVLRARAQLVSQKKEEQAAKLIAERARTLDLKTILAPFEAKEEPQPPTPEAPDAPADTSAGSSPPPP